MRVTLLLLLVLLAGPAWTQAGGLSAPVHHDIAIVLDPDRQALTVSDRIALPRPMRQLILQLHAGLAPHFHADGGDVQVTRLHADRDRERYRIDLPAGATRVRVDYAGTLHHALSASRAEQSRGFRDTPGLIDPQGVFLAHSSLWYPHLQGFDLLTYSLQVDLPRGWSSVSQGTRERRRTGGDRTRERWAIDRPQEAIYLIAAPFTEYRREIGGRQGPVEAQVFLREPDRKLADRYLDATAAYLQMYERLLGPYPYDKFALVENFWETGFGMPSFTLLGSRVIRLPFIVDSSYPHEILHNWWGNGVYVDVAGGNWSEGLTAYLADHLIKQQQGQGADYRQQSLQKYRDYAAQGRDFPLSRFRGRHDPATEAVGYGKTMMLFHMLRRQLGDDRFVQALRTLYRQYRFAMASFDDVRRVFETTAGRPLQAFFDQWVGRTGAPELAIAAPVVEAQAGRYRLRFRLRQLQPGDPYRLDVPVAVSLEGRPRAHEFVVTMTAREQEVDVDLPAKPTRVDVDPGFDLFRRLAIEETPPAFTQVFGANTLLVVVPANAHGDLQAAWQTFAQEVAHMGPERVDIVRDDALAALPDDRAVMVLGWTNRFTPQVQRELERHPVRFDDSHVHLGSQGRTPVAQHVFAWVTRVGDADSGPRPRALIVADRADALPGLARKLPHYHKYSYLAFAGEAPDNRVKGRWPVTASPLSRALTPGAAPAPRRPEAALIEPVSEFDAARMMRTIGMLSGWDLQGRGLGSAGLERAAAFIAQAFAQAGLQPAGDGGGYFQRFTAQGEHGRRHVLKNVVGVLPGRHAARASANLVVGAHYDHLGLGWPDVRARNRGRLHPGADDNASGVAVMLELARSLGRGFEPDRSVVFAAFSAEEAGRLGSKHYVAHAHAHPVSDAIGMLNLDTVGRLFDGPLAVLGAESAAEWPPLFRGIGVVTGIRTALVDEPLDASDQVSFHEAGVPAVQLFSGAHADYHRPGDTADKIDAAGLVKVAEVSRQVIDYLAAREQPLTGDPSVSAKDTDRAAGRGRRVSLGSIPDFTYRGSGYRLDGVVPDSPADRAGLSGSDIIVAIDDVAIHGIRDLADNLNGRRPGQRIRIRFLRNGDERETEVELSAK